MNRKEYELMYRFEEQNWWFVIKRKVLETVLNSFEGPGEGTDRSPRILDVGCGTGIIPLLLQRYGSVWGLDISQEALQFCKKRKLTQFVCQSDGLTIPFQGNTFDIITAIDVIEHVERDEVMLKECYRVLRVGGRLYITTSAYPFLWSEHDEAVGHKRRYTFQELKNKVQKAGFKVKKLTHYHALIFFPVLVLWGLKKMLGLQNLFKTTHIEISPFFNKICTQVLKIEPLVLKNVNIPFGISLLCVGEKEARN
jgi:ubiquinone/menaquinone biosynthesis C-methylase UbiE